MGIVCALATEARHLRPTPLPPGSSIESLSDGTLLSVSGMGADAAARSARALIQAGAGAVVSFGLAGGLDPLLRAGDILLPREILSAGIPSLATASGWRERVAAVLIERVPGARIFDGGLFSCAHIVTGVAEKSALFGSSGAQAVDMESFAMAEVTSTHRLPFLALRVIIDRAGDELPRLVMAAADASGEVRPWRLASALMRAPSELAPLLRLGSRYRSASRSLAAVARIGGWSRLAFA